MYILVNFDFNKLFTDENSSKYILIMGFIKLKIIHILISEFKLLILFYEF